MPNVKVGANQPGNDITDTEEEEATTSFNVPIFKIKTIPGVFQAETSEPVNPEEIHKQDLNKDVSHFIDRDIHLRERYSQLRHLAILSFVFALLASCLTIADIEISKTTRGLLARALNCEETYVSSYLRKCPALSEPVEVMRDDLINQSVYDELIRHNTYFKRWLAANKAYAYEPWIIDLAIKSAISFLSIAGVLSLFAYHRAELAVLKLKRYLPEDSPFIKSPKLKSFTIKTLLTLFHVPPLVDAWVDVELQLAVTLRLVLCGIKVLKECNGLRYHRLGNVLSNLARIKIHGTFLLKTYFMLYPQTSLCVVYLLVIAALPYFMILSEYREGYTVNFQDACWLMVVTVTNLGSGEVRPQTIGARIVVGFASLVGIVTTALWVNVIAKYMELPQEERRILAMVEHQRVRTLERKKAAACIQAAWRLYHYQRHNTAKTFRLVQLQKTNKKAVWEWKCVRQQCSRLKRTIEADFSTEDTLIVARNMARRMSSTNTIIASKKSIADIVWDQRRSSHFLQPGIPSMQASFIRHSDEINAPIQSMNDKERSLGKSDEEQHLTDAINALQKQVKSMNEQFQKTQRTISLQLNELQKTLRNNKNNT